MGSDRPAVSDQCVLIRATTRASHPIPTRRQSMKAARGICSAAGRLILGYAMVLATATMASAQTAPAAPPVGGAREGITVHGRWVVEVQNPDGTIVSRTEFNNALSGGGQHLVHLLSRTGVPGRWVLYLTSSGTSLSPCQGGTGGTDR